MFRKLYSLAKFETNIAMDNKFVIIYTFLFPSIYFIYQALATPHTNYTESEILTNLLGFWGYIIVTGVLNGVISGMLSMRENNFLKMFSYIIGNKNTIFLANLIPQVLIIQAELIIFNIIALIIYGFNLALLNFVLTTLILNFILIPIIAFFTTFFLIIPMRGASYNILMTGYLFAGLALLSVRSDNNWINILLSALNPYQYIIDFYNLVYSSLNLQWSSLIFLTVIAIFYILIGRIIIAKMDIRSSTTR